MRLYDSNHSFTRLTERAYHLNGISRGIFWTNGTALFLSMEMDRIEPYYLIPSFEITAGGSLDNNKDGVQTYVLADKQKRNLIPRASSTFQNGVWKNSLDNAELTPLLIGSFIREG